MIDVDIDVLKLAPPPHEVEHFKEEFLPDAKFQAWKKEMEDKYQNQKLRGGIIDREMEDNRFLLVTENIQTADLLATSPTEEEPQTNQPAPPVQATATSKVPATGKTEWSRSQRPGRGRWNQRSEMALKEKPTTGHNGPRPSNSSNRTSTQERHPFPNRKPGEKSIHSNAVRSNGEVSLSAPLRPPPGFGTR